MGGMTIAVITRAFYGHAAPFGRGGGTFLRKNWLRQLLHHSERRRIFPARPTN